MCGTACLPDVNLGEGGVAVLCLGVGWGVGGCLPDVDLGDGGVVALSVGWGRGVGEGRVRGCGWVYLPDVDLGEGGVAAQCVDDHRRLGAKFGISDG